MANPKIDMFEELFNTIREADQDLVQDLLKTVLERLMSAEADSLCGAGYGERSQERMNRRNGYRLRPWDSRVGSIDLAVPKLRQGSYFPDWLLDIHRRSERALVSVVAEAWVRGVSHRRMEGLVNALGIERLSRTQVSEMVKSLDEEVAAFRNRPLDAGPYRHVWLDAMQVKCREAGRVVNVALVLATAVNADGRREALGMDVITSEDGAGWTAFLRGLVARGLSGVKLVTSDAHEGLKAAVAAVLPGASWQRCRTHFMRNLLTRVPKSAQNMVATVVRSIFAQPSAEETWAQHARVVAQLRKGFPEAAAMLEDAADELLAFTAFPKEHWKQIWSNNPQERQNREIRRRTDVVGIFPHRGSIIRLVGALLSEQNDEWLVASRRYMSIGSLEKLAKPSTALETKLENKELPVAV